MKNLYLLLFLHIPILAEFLATRIFRYSLCKLTIVKLKHTYYTTFFQFGQQISTIFKKNLRYAQNQTLQIDQ